MKLKYFILGKMMFVMFAYSGWNASVYIAGELKNPRKTLPLSLLIGTGIVVIVYLLINIFIFQAVPFVELKGVVTVVESAAVKAFGSWMGSGLSLVVSIALLSSLSAYIIIGPRVYYAMANDRMFFPFAAKIHHKYNVPGYSILIQGALAVIMIMVGSFEQLLVYLGFALNIFPWLAIAGVFIVRKRNIGNESAYLTWGYPIIPTFYLISSILLMIVAFMNRPLESSIAILTIGAGIIFYNLGVYKRMSVMKRRKLYVFVKLKMMDFLLWATLSHQEQVMQIY